MKPAVCDGCPITLVECYSWLMICRQHSVGFYMWGCLGFLHMFHMFDTCVLLFKIGSYSVAKGSLAFLQESSGFCLFRIGIMSMSRQAQLINMFLTTEERTKRPCMYWIEHWIERAWGLNFVVLRKALHLTQSFSGVRVQCYSNCFVGFSEHFLCPDCCQAFWQFSI